MRAAIVARGIAAGKTFTGPKPSRRPRPAHDLLTYGVRTGVRPVSERVPESTLPTRILAQPVRATRDSISDIWGARAGYYGEDQWPARSDERTSQEPDRWVPSACVLCSTGCGLDIGVKDGRIVGVRGRAADRVNRGRLGPKGLHGWEANHSSDRLTRPLVRRGSHLEPTSWDEAMDLVASRSQDIKSRYGPGALAFYNSGQLCLEEYYTLAVIAEVGVGTSHLDGNTRLCTSTAAIALMESFGTDGAPGTYADLDTADTIFQIGHNMAETQTVLWTRILDRRHGQDPPRLVVADPRRTPTALEADVHLAPRLGTNVALMNGLLHLIIESGRIDRDFVAAHTVGFEALADLVGKWPPDRVAEVTQIPEERLRAAATILGAADRLVSTVLQGVYQSNQASAAAIQVNNLHLIRGMIGKPGATVFQMNGQPTAQNTRECGANGELIAFRNWQNPRHVAEYARVLNVEPAAIPTWTPPTPAMQIFRYVETGSIRFLWIIGTNPAVSLPDLARIRKVLDREGLFLVVSDAFPTETTRYADVVLPAALWGEKTGCVTNADRTVHLAHKAVEPPGDARSDLEILLAYARRMDFHDRDGGPLVTWRDPEGAFEAWRACSKGRPCDYSGMTYAKLSEAAGIQWPCTEDAPHGTRRLYTGGVFNTAADYCEIYGHDLVTGAEISPEQYRANDPRGRAIIKPADYMPPVEEPDSRYPFWLTTGRVVYHWHTRTKTGRVAALQSAAPRSFVEVSARDADRLGIADGSLVRIGSRRGEVEVEARIREILPGHLFMPFHYGDEAESKPGQAGNDLTITDWDPVSKQPHFKFAAVWLAKA
jgi:ferredoxin-nitrate reductase